MAAITGPGGPSAAAVTGPGPYAAAYKWSLRTSYRWDQFSRDRPARNIATRFLEKQRLFYDTVREAIVSGGAARRRVECE